jgi:hypothetical protein
MQKKDSTSSSISKFLVTITLSLVILSCNKDDVGPDCENCGISIFESVTSSPYKYTEDSFIKYHPGQEWCAYLDSLSTTDTISFLDSESQVMARGVKYCD